MSVRICGLALAWCVSLGAGIAGIAPASAQETINTASISGRVSDATGGVLPGATVSVRHVETNTSREAVTDEGGRFRLSYLRIGVYQIKVHLAGFVDASRSLTVSAGSAFELPIT